MKITAKSNAGFLQSGQVAVVILLIMSVLVVISFSLAGRTTNEVSLSTQTSESTAVFNAAETGINEAMARIFQEIEAGQTVDFNVEENRDLDGDPEGTADVKLKYNAFESNEISTRLMEGASLVIKLDPTSPRTDPVLVQWATESNCYDRASLLISIYSDDSGTTRARHYPVGCDHGNSDQFALPNSDTNKGDFQNGQLIAVTANDLFIRIKAIYNDANLRVVGYNSDLPTQAYIAEARATNLLGDKQETRVLKVTRSHAVAPSILDYAVYSGSDLVK